MRSPIEKLGIAWSTQPEAGYTPEQHNDRHVGGGGGPSPERDRPTASTEQTEGEMMDYPPGDMTPDEGIDGREPA